jgi:cytoskeletal protein RodZ
MIDLGSELRAAREEQGISLDEAEVATRIRGRYLKALETNDWTALPTHVQARGFLRNYAIYLGIEEDRVTAWYGQLARSAGAVTRRLPAADASVRTTDEDGSVFRPRDIDIEGLSALPAWLSSDILIGVILALLVAVVGFALIRMVSDNADETSAGVTTPSPGLTPVLTQALSQPTTGAGVSPGVATPASVTPTFDASVGSVQLSLEATEHVWVRVTVDGTQVLEGILAPGAPQAWQGTQQILLETPNGAGLQAVVNGQPQGPLGERGQPITLAWGPTGLLPITPTPLP